MRNLSRTMIGLMLGAAIVLPPVAQAQERGRDRGAMINGDSRRAAVQQAREANRAVERPAPVMTPRAAPTPDASARAPRAERSWNRGGDNGAAPQRSWNRGGDTQAAQQRDATRGSTPGEDRRRSWNRGGQNDQANQGNRDDRTGRNWTRDGNRGAANDRDRRWNNDRRDGSGDGRTWDRNDRDRRGWADRDGRRDNDRWNRNWRTDRRYDWRDYRNHNRGIYRLPRYVAPRWGYSYQRWYPGYRWDPWFYGSSYWISDPWSYRLPAAYGDYRWVRYYDDAVLVDIRTGEIIDIIYSFFF
ncbi:MULTISPECIES: RcnB family protein [unclassified Sphingomonas]|uniref:RcnB family protein n=1 Tax=unclassified Sphingomonas TaxID=196159 RepID=UPI000A746E8C|nr:MULTISPECIES: RcnB family protein [unclassified Sphingomonas]